MTSVLQVTGVHKAFGGLKVLDGVELAIQPGEVVGLIGPNGSGKTTLINILTGFYRPDAGRVLLDGLELAGLAPHQVFRRGVVRTFQITRIFPRLTARDNLLAAGASAGVRGALAHRRAGQLLTELGLGSMAFAPAGHLSGGQRKLLEFAGCFMSDHLRVVALDEPFAAVHPDVKAVMLRLLQARQRADRAFLVVSHDIPELASFCPRTVVMGAGRVVADGPTGRVLQDPAVVEAYLGGVR